MPDTLVFPDAGLHIAVLGALLDDGVIDASVITSALVGLPQADLPGAVARLHAVPLGLTAIAGLTSLQFDGGNAVYMMLEDGAGVYTGGESDDYCLRSLHGIAALNALRELNLDGHGYRETTLDLNPLAGHPRLEVLALSGSCAPASVLESLPRLTSLEMSVAKVDDDSVVTRLAARGVCIIRR